MSQRLSAGVANRAPSHSTPERWTPRLACPECGDVVRPDGPTELVCRSCVLRFECRDGVYRFLTKDRVDALAPFLKQYRLVRTSEGYRTTSPDYYRALPHVAAGDRHAAEWRIRRQSYQQLRYHALRPMMRSPLRVLDLGAGNGWLSHRLTSLGHSVVAVDSLDDDVDGLGACRHYDLTFTRVQADFNALPFAPAQFDLAVFEGSLHYSPDPLASLARAHRLLAPGGVLAVMDSPMFERERDGQAMLDRRDRQMTLDYGLTAVVRPGTGFLTYGLLDRAATLLGRSGHFYRSRGSLQWRLRRQVARLRLRRAPAAFGVWVAI